METRLSAMLGSLEDHFRQVAVTAMAELPIINPRLSVQAVGFHPGSEGWLGVLITPWFISLVLLPEDGDGWQALPMGSRQNHCFPSGSYDFLVAEAEGIGRFKTCSLLSPVLEIADQDTAVQVALAALRVLNREEFRDTTSSPAPEVQPDAADTSTPPAERTMSRRDFFRARFGGDDGDDGDGGDAS